jgi:glucan 1,3-beta-glucosidase
MLLIICIDCGNSIQGNNGPAPDGNAKCDMKCDGNSNEICGGANRMCLYSRGGSEDTYSTNAQISTATTTSTATAASATQAGDGAWHYRGCYTDTAARTLIHGIPVSDTMTVAKCQASCRALGYALAGVEWGIQCCESPFSFFFYRFPAKCRR